MRRTIFRSTAFVRTAKRAIKKQNSTWQDLQTTLDLLAEDAFNPALKTHKLKGDLAGLWACSLGYDLRLIFEFIVDGGIESIRVHTIGTHDEIY